MWGKSLSEPFQIETGVELKQRSRSNRLNFAVSIEILNALLETAPGVHR
jgi:hypothetical protein